MDLSCFLKKNVDGTDYYAAKLECLPPLFYQLIYWLLIFAGIIALFLIVFSGFRYITSGGDPKQVEGARKTLTYTIIGLLIILLSFFILNVIAQVTGVNCIRFFGLTSCSS